MVRKFEEFKYTRIKWIYKELRERSRCYGYTNGLAEGFVNKLKTIKRSMYGKASFQTLRRKILWSERD